MDISITTVNIKFDEHEQRAEQALKNWIIDHGHVCGIDDSHHLCPKFIMICDNVHGYRRAVEVFSEIWIEFNDAGLSEAVFMSVYRSARQSIEKED